jgi:hypothetical protein
MSSEDARLDSQAWWKLAVHSIKFDSLYFSCAIVEIFEVQGMTSSSIKCYFIAQYSYIFPPLHSVFLDESIFILIIRNLQLNAY